MEVGRIILAVFKRFEAIDDQRFGGWLIRLMRLLEQKAVPSQAGGLIPDCRGGDIKLPGDLPKGGAGEDPVKELSKDIRAFQPVVRRECLLAEIAVAVQAFVALNSIWLGLPEKETGLLIPPSLRVPVIPAQIVGTVRRLELGSTFRHTLRSVQDTRQMQSSKHNPLLDLP